MREDLLRTIDNILSVEKREKLALKEWIRQMRKGWIEILITGRTGVGKSTLVNCLIGEKVATVGSDLRPTTKNVQKYTFETEKGMGMKVVVWDSPGLQDGSVNEEEYLAEMKEKCSNYDVVFYCIPLTPRSELDANGGRDFRATQLLTAKFGPNFWNHTIFVMTFANTLERRLMLSYEAEQLKEKFDECLKEWKEKINKALSAAGVPKNTLDNIPVVPAGAQKKPHLPGQKYWLSYLWFTFLQRAKLQSKLTLLTMGFYRFKREAEARPTDFEQEGYAQPIVISKKILTATVLGAGIGGGLGIGVGTLAGPIWAILIGSVGAAMGIATGGAIGITAVLLYMIWKHK